MQTLESIHEKIHTRVKLLHNWVEYSYFSLVRLCNCVAEGRTPERKQAGGSRTNVVNQLDVEASDCESDESGYAEATRATLERALRELNGRIVDVEELRSQYRYLSTPVLAKADGGYAALRELETQLNVHNVLLRMDGLRDQLRTLSAGVEASDPRIQHALNTVMQASIETDALIVPVPDEDSPGEQADSCEMQIALSGLQLTLGEFLRWSYADTNRAIYERYAQVDVVFPKPPRVNLCECGQEMVIDQINSESFCQGCGITEEMKGVVFEEAQLFSQQAAASKPKNYKFNSHCEKWLNQLLAEEKRMIEESVVDRVDARAMAVYRNSDGTLRDMRQMRYAEVRAWLKVERLTKYNNNATLIRRLVTAKHGEAVVPPRMSLEEKSEVLGDFSRAMDTYERFDDDPEMLKGIGKTEVGNKPYYPDGLRRILTAKFHGDSRLPRWLECIHLQTEQTIRRHDQRWALICRKIIEENPGEAENPQSPFIYRATNRTKLIYSLGGK
jgi:hypothetical protein